MSVLIVDYEMCNIRSVVRAFEECGAKVIVSKDPKDLDRAERIVLPGVGAFLDGMTNLSSKGWVEPLTTVLTENKLPFLGICLGMQLLATLGTEVGETRGLNLIPGKVDHMKNKCTSVRYPHMGWNEIHHAGNHPLLKGIPTGTDFYFAHSFHFVVEDSKTLLATTPYGFNFNSVVQKDNLSAVQFHPEKSGVAGFQVIKNFLAM